MINTDELKEGMMIRRIGHTTNLFKEESTYTIFYDIEWKNLCITSSNQQVHPIKYLTRKYWEVVEDSLEQKIENLEQELETLNKQVEEQNKKDDQLIVTQGSLVLHNGIQLLVARQNDEELGLITVDTGNYWVNKTVPRKTLGTPYEIASFPITDLDEDLTPDVTTLIKF